MLATYTLACTPPEQTPSPSSTTSSSTTTSTTTGTTLVPTSTSSTSTTGPECPPDDAPPPCGPPERPLVIDFRLDAKGGFDEDQEEYEESCMVMNAAIEQTDVALNFVCFDAMNQVTVHEVRATLDPPPLVPPLQTGDMATLRVKTEVFFEVANRHVAVLDAEQRLALLFVAGDMPASTFTAPLVVTAESPCPQVCPEPGCGFILDECPCDRRLALDFTLDGDTTRVHGGTFDTWPGPPAHEFRVLTAQCREGPAEGANFCSFGGCWFNFLVLRVP